LDEMRAFREEWKKESGELKASIDTFMGRIEKIEESHEQLKERVKELEKENGELKRKWNDSEQYGRKGNIIIAGIPEKGRDEDILETVKEVGEQVGVAIDARDITIAHRIPTKYKTNKPTIIVKFCNWF